MEQLNYKYRVLEPWKRKPSGLRQESSEVFTERDCGVTPRPWKINRNLECSKEKKVFPIEWNDWTLKPRQCEYVKVSKDFFPRISNSSVQELEGEVGGG